jgi:hypothetical protein
MVHSKKFEIKGGFIIFSLDIETQKENWTKYKLDELWHEFIVTGWVSLNWTQNIGLKCNSHGPICSDSKCHNVTNHPFFEWENIDFVRV